MCEPWQYYVKEKILDNKEAQSFKGRVGELEEIVARPSQVRHPWKPSPLIASCILISPYSWHPPFILPTRYWSVPYLFSPPSFSFTGCQFHLVYSDGFFQAIHKFSSWTTCLLSWILECILKAHFQCSFTRKEKRHVLFLWWFLETISYFFFLVSESRFSTYESWPLWGLNGLFTGVA